MYVYMYICNNIYIYDNINNIVIICNEIMCESSNNNMK